ncbi:MAG: M56 family metallopeptidase [Bacillota bacterium]
MPLIPVSLVVHVALTSVLSVGWAIAALYLFRVRHAAARRWILASAVLLPVAGFIGHLVYPRNCTGISGLSTHFACLTSSSLGDAGTWLFASSLALAALQAFVIWVAQRRAARDSVPLSQFVWEDPETGAKAQQAVKELEDRTGMWLTVDITERPGICCTVGVLRPVIVVSEDLCRSLDLAEFKAALAHEAAHISQNDAFIGLASALVKALTFFSPAAYLGIRLYMDEREKAADDLAASITEDPLALASAIVKVAQAGRPSVAVANAVGNRVGRITGRVQRLLGGVELQKSRLGAPLAIASLASFVGLVLITVLVC